MKVVEVKHRPRSSQAYKVVLDDTHEVVVRRIRGPLPESRDGVSISWHSAMSAMQLLEKCIDPGRATAEADVLIADPESSDEPHETPLDDPSAVSQIERGDSDGRIIQFNAPFWSLTIWPRGEQSERVIEFAGPGYSETIPQMIAASIAVTIQGGVDALATHLRKIVSTLLGDRPAVA